MNELFWPCFAMTSIFFVGGWLSSFLGGSTNYQMGVGSSLQQTWFLPVAFTHYFCPQFQPQSVILGAIIPLVFIWLAYRDIPSGQAEPGPLLAEEFYFMVNFFLINVLNQNTFKLTVMTFPLIHIVSFRFILLEQFSTFYNPYSGEELTAKNKQGYYNQRMVVFIGVYVIFIFLRWMSSRDLIVQAIKNRMITQQ
jgi:hypothetical protein